MKPQDAKLDLSGSCLRSRARHDKDPKVVNALILLNSDKSSSNPQHRIGEQTAGIIRSVSGWSISPDVISSKRP